MNRDRRCEGICQRCCPANSSGDNGSSRPLLERIRELAFVKNELELYLDTHPNCSVALDYYKQTVNALKSLTEEYENTSAPLTAMGVTGETWTWTDTPWPWHHDGN